MHLDICGGCGSVTQQADLPEAQAHTIFTQHYYTTLGQKTLYVYVPSDKYTLPCISIHPPAKHFHI